MLCLCVKSGGLRSKILSAFDGVTEIIKRANMIRENFKKLSKRILKEVKSDYKEKLITLAIFGSVARERMNSESDIDLLIIAENLPEGRMKRIRQFDRIEKKLEPDLAIMQKKRIYTCFSPMFKTPEEVKRGSPLFLDMVFDLKILYDKNDFFWNYLADFKKRLDKLGAKRIVQGERWYWILKPDYKWGEVLEI